MNTSDRRPPVRRALGDATGRAPGERLSEYFDFTTWPEKMDRKVTRVELLTILRRKWEVEEASRWYRRLWHWLTSPRQPKTPKPTTPPEAS